MPAKLKKPKTEPKTNDENYNSLLSEEVFTVLDIETSGLSPKSGGEIIELAAVRVSRGRITETYDTLIQPRNKIYSKTTEITGITNEDLIGQPTIDKIIPKLVEFMGGSTLVAHNAVFEQRFLEHEFKKFGYAPKNHWLCTMKLFRFLYPERKTMGLSAKLDDLTEHYEINFTEEDHHRALPDTIATAKALIEMRKEVLDNEFIQEELLLNPDVEVTVQEEEKINNFYIASVNYWEKCFNRKRDKWVRRLYIHFTSEENITGTIYYDLYTNSYVVQRCENKYTKESYPVDLKAFESALLERIKTKNIKEYLTKQGIFKRVQKEFKERMKDKFLFIQGLYPDASIQYVKYQKANIPFDVFEITENDVTQKLFVTNEKRGSKYRVFQNINEIK